MKIEEEIMDFVNKNLLARITIKQKNKAQIYLAKVYSREIKLDADYLNKLELIAKMPV